MQQQRPVELLIVGGIVGGAAGLAAGGVLGYTIATGGECSPEFCGLGGALLGAAAGEVVLLSLGVHLANGGQGSYGYDLLASAGTMVGGFLLAGAAFGAGDQAGELVLWAIPVAQLASVIAVERKTSRRRQPHLD